MEGLSTPTPNCPPPSIYLQNKLDEKKYYLSYDNNKYELLISLFEGNESDNKEKIFNFKLNNMQKISEKGENFYYENNKYLSQLINLFFINIYKTKDPITTIFEKIEKFHSTNCVTIEKNNKSEEILDLVYNLKTFDNENIELIIELNKKEVILNEKKENKSLEEEVEFLKNSLRIMEEKYKKQNNEIKNLENKINDLSNDLKKYEKKKLIIEEKQKIFKSNLSQLNNMKIISSDIDGGRGVNDLFEVYHLYNDIKSVYIAIKVRDYDDISYIDIIKISSINNFQKKARLKGHQKRINFIKYFINPYNKKEYLISGDREERVRVWGILDENNYKSLIHIITNYGRLLFQQSIYNCILYFTEYKNYIYTTTVTENCSRLYDLEDGSLVKNISITENNYTFFLITYNDLIVDVCKNYTIIYQLFNEEIYDKIECSETKGDNRAASIIYDKDNTDYLIISNCTGNLIVYDLKKKVINKIIKLNKDLYTIVPWDLNTLIVTEYNTEYLGVIDLNNKKVKSNTIKCNSGLICVKKIILNEKDEILFAAGENSKNVYMLLSSPINSLENESQVPKK